MKILPIIGIFLLGACTKEVTHPLPTQSIKVTFSIDSALTQTGINSLPLSNGFYHLKLNTNTNQTLSRITGKFEVNGTSIQSVEPKISWTSSHYIVISKGDTISKIIKTYFNPYTGQLQPVNLPALISQTDVAVSVVNPTSIPDFQTGKVNIMTGPVLNMKGDTITIIGKAKWFLNNKIDSSQKSIRIICE